MMELSIEKRERSIYSLGALWTSETRYILFGKY